MLAYCASRKNMAVVVGSTTVQACRNDEDGVLTLFDAEPKTLSSGATTLAIRDTSL